MKSIPIDGLVAALYGIREHAGYTGVFTRQQAPGAIPNGSRIRKSIKERTDRHEVGAQGVVLGSLHQDRLGYGYFVEWDDKPKHAIFVAGRIERIT